MTNATCLGSPLAGAALLAGFCAYPLPVQIQQPRSIIALGTSTVLALERSTQSVVLLDDSNGDSIPDRRRTVATAPNLNHGLAIDLEHQFLYASSDSTVYRWSFTTTSSALVGNVSDSTPTTVVINLNANGKGGSTTGGHVTRSLTLDATGTQLYVSVGAYNNVDTDSFRSRIRRLNVATTASSKTTTLPLDYVVDGEVFADGLRNEVGLAWDKHGVLWGVENGPDNLKRPDLGGDIHNDNPAEELNRFAVAGKHYGYPYCWTEYNLPTYGLGRGTVWAWPATELGSTTYTDSQCRNVVNFQPPEVAMQGHSAPLGIVFYKYRAASQRPKGCTGTFPSWMDGYAFIAFHGSWNRSPPTGYKVVYVAMDAKGRAIGQPVDFLKHQGTTVQWDDGFRPVGVDFDACGRLLVSSDGSGSGSKIVRIDYLVVRDSGDGGGGGTGGNSTSGNCRTRLKNCRSSTQCCSGLKCVRTLEGTRKCKNCRRRGRKCWQTNSCCPGLRCVKPQGASQQSGRCRPNGK